MIFYNNFLAKCFLGKKKHYFMIGGLFFTRYKYLEVWEEMELRIHARQFWECFLLTLIPALAFTVVIMVVDDTSVHSISSVLLV